jgi:hypothetical protein
MRPRTCVTCSRGESAFWSIIAAICAVGLSGCMQDERNAQLSQVAKGWARTIRASQVIPVYPLTEDVQVGDIFIVQRPIEDEAKIYDESGFLPLGHHLGRLEVRGFPDFYLAADYSVAQDARLPGFFRRPPPPNPADAARTAADRAPNNAGPGSSRHLLPTNWSAAPRASFPSYSFEIKRAAGVNIGIPVQGVPVGLGLLGAESAVTSVSLKDAYSYGVGVDAISEDLRSWVEDPANKKLLETYSPVYSRDENDGGYRVRYNFLRVVTRIYLVGRVNVSIVDSSSAGADAKVGLAENIKLIPSSTQPAEDLRKYIAAVNEGLLADANDSEKPKRGGDDADAPAADSGAEVASATTPAAGGRLKLVSATNRSVSLDETFDRPLVVGYIAYDLPIGFGGVVGSRPVSTQTRLKYDGRSTLRKRILVDDWIENHPQADDALRPWMRVNYHWLKNKGLPTNTEEMVNRLDRPSIFQMIEHAFVPGNKWARLNQRIISEVIERPEGLPYEEAQVPGGHPTTMETSKG